MNQLIFEAVCKRLLQEAKRDISTAIERAAEAPPDAPLGRIAFAMNRKKVPKEPNTAVEDHLLKSLTKYFNDNSKIDKKSLQVIKKIIEMGWYKKIFNEPTPDTEVYRGLTVPVHVLQELIGDEPTESGEKDVDLLITGDLGVAGWSNKDITSWTVDEDVALNFAVESYQGDESMNWALVLTAVVGDNPGKFLSGPNGLYKVNDFNRFYTEDEILGLGPIRVKKIGWSDLTDF